MDLIAALALIPGIGPYLPLIAIVYPLIVALPTFMPTPGPSGWYAAIHAIINAAALNIGKAKNKDAP